MHYPARRSGISLGAPSRGPPLPNPPPPPPPPPPPAPPQPIAASTPPFSPRRPFLPPLVPPFFLQRYAPADDLHQLLRNRRLPSPVINERQSRNHLLGVPRRRIHGGH